MSRLETLDVSNHMSPPTASLLNYLLSTRIEKWSKWTLAAKEKQRSSERFDSIPVDVCRKAFFRFEFVCPTALRAFAKSPSTAHCSLPRVTTSDIWTIELLPSGESAHCDREIWWTGRCGQRAR